MKKVAFITGSGRGIGRAIAIELSQAGYRVVVTSRSQSQLQETVSLCRSVSDTVALALDLTQPTDRQRLIDATIERFGRLDVLVNNAGTHETHDPATWEPTLILNLMAAIDVTRLALPHLRAQQGAAVVNIASIAGIMSTGPSPAYVASKHGVMGFSRALFDQIREEGVKVCAICPGLVATDLIDKSKMDQSKMIQPADIAKAVQFVLGFPSNACPTEIVIRPQRAPRAG